MNFRRALLTALVMLTLAACGQESLKSVRFETPPPAISFTVQIPVSWQYQVSKLGIVLGSSFQAVSAPDDSSLPRGSVFGNIVVIDQRVAAHMGAGDAAGLIEIFAQNSEIGLAYSKPEAITIDDRAGVQSFLHTADSDNRLLVLELADNYVLTTFTTPQGELDGHTDMLNEIALSIELIKH